jgi:hypothetical protein
MGVTVEFNRLLEFEARALSNIEDAHEDAGRDHVRESRFVAPEELGDLKDSIEAETQELPGGGYITVVTCGVFYGIFVEFGTGIHATGEGGSNAKQVPWVYFNERWGRWVTTYGNVPQPFFRPGAESAFVFIGLRFRRIYDAR